MIEKEGGEKREERWTEKVRRMKRLAVDVVGGRKGCEG